MNNLSQFPFLLCVKFPAFTTVHHAYETHRHRATPMQAVDGSLSFRVSLELHKSTPYREMRSFSQKVKLKSNVF